MLIRNIRMIITYVIRHHQFDILTAHFSEENVGLADVLPFINTAL